jgi:LAS superfamily LD-carboxypeptidase LdcB
MEMITINSERECKTVSKKPPLPPKPLSSHKSSAKCEQKSKAHQQWKAEDDNAQQVQKLMALNEKMNIEIVDMRKQLSSERCAVRELR